MLKYNILYGSGKTPTPTLLDVADIRAISHYEDGTVQIFSYQGTFDTAEGKFEDFEAKLTSLGVEII